MIEMDKIDKELFQNEKDIIILKNEIKNLNKQINDVHKYKETS